MKISIIAAIAENNVIGNNNDLIWHISEDLKRFKKLTSGHSIIMGRKTYDSLPFKPLPKRQNIIISKQKDLKYDGALVVHSVQEALDICKKDAEIFICGGAQIYKAFLTVADAFYITKVFRSFEGDTFFPEIDFSKLTLTEESEKFYDAKSNLHYAFYNYARKS